MRPILIVEDDPDIREGLAQVLEGAGYPVLEAADGAEGLALLRSGAQPALILLDLMMPVMDGWDFRRAQRKDPALAAIPVVVVSGVADVREESALLEPDDYMVKPVRANALLAVVARHAGPGRAPA